MVTWSVESAQHEPVTSKINQQGELTVSENETNETLIVKATSQFDKSKFDTANVIILEDNKVISVSVTPETAQLYPNGEKQFTANVEVTGSASKKVAWNVVIDDETVKANISPTGLLRVESDSAVGEITVKAISVEESSVFGTAVVTVVKPPEIEVLLNGEKTTSVKVEPNQKININAQVINDSRNQGVTWSATDESFYTKETTKLAYNITVKGEATPDKTSTITATSVADPTKTATYTITVKQPPFIDVQPNTAEVKQGGEIEFTATLKGFDNENLTWTVESGTGTTKITPNESDKKKAVLTVDSSQSVATPLTVKCEGKPNVDTEAISDTSVVNVSSKSEYELIPLRNCEKTTGLYWGYYFKKGGQIISAPTGGVYSGTANGVSFGNLGFSNPVNISAKKPEIITVMLLNEPIPNITSNHENIKEYEIKFCYDNNCGNISARGNKTFFTINKPNYVFYSNKKRLMKNLASYTEGLNVESIVNESPLCFAINGELVEGATTSLEFINQQVNLTIDVTNCSIPKGTYLVSSLWSFYTVSNTGRRTKQLINTLNYMKINYS